MFTKALILVLLGSTLVVCSPEPEPLFLHKRDGKPGLTGRVFQRNLNFTGRQIRRVGDVIKGATREAIGFANDVKDVAFGTIGDVAEAAADKWGIIKNGTWGTLGAISHGIKDAKEAWFPSDDIPHDFLDQCLSIQKNGGVF